VALRLSFQVFIDGVRLSKLTDNMTLLIITVTIGTVYVKTSEITHYYCYC